MIQYDTSGTSTVNIHGNTSSYTIHANWGQGGTTSPPTTGCNESKAFGNDEKALYHGLKSAYRMSRPFDGSEYGTADPPYETAARIAANVAIAYLMATEQLYTRDESWEYIDENFAQSAFPSCYFRDVPLSDRVDEDEFEEAIGHSWHQIDVKRNHYDAARTALAAADVFLGEKMEEYIQVTLDLCDDQI